MKLDKNDLTKFDGIPTHLFGFNPMHAWERYGEANEYPTVAWIEGPWVIKRNGIYYLEYSASGTQWKSYAEGYYTATSPLGPYTYAENNPWEAMKWYGTPPFADHIYTDEDMYALQIELFIIH